MLDALQVERGVAQVVARGLVEAGLVAGQRAAQLLRGVGQRRHHRLLLLRLRGDSAQALVQQGQSARQGAALLGVLRHRALQHVERVGGLLQQRLDVGRHGAVALGATAGPGREAGQAGQPLFQILQEAVVRLARLQFQEAHHQRAGEAEERGGEGRAHALQRLLQIALERLEQHRGVAAVDLQAGDGLAHRAHGLRQPPEGAEQAEEDQQADQVAREIVALVDAVLDAVEQRAHRDGGELQLAAALAQHAGHRRQQARRRQVGQALRPVEPVARLVAEALQPAHLGHQQDHLADDVGGAQHDDAENHAVEEGAGEEGSDQPLGQHAAERGHQCQEDQDAQQIARRPRHGPPRRTRRLAARRLTG